MSSGKFKEGVKNQRFTGGLMLVGTVTMIVLDGSLSIPLESTDLTK